MHCSLFRFCATAGTCLAAILMVYLLILSQMESENSNEIHKLSPIQIQQIMKNKKILKRMKRRPTNTIHVRKPFDILYLCDFPHFMNESLVILSMVSNSERSLKRVLYQLDSFACIFREVFIIFYESNSNDNTRQMLNAWMNEENIFQCSDYKWRIFNTENHSCNHSKYMSNKINDHKSVVHKILLNIDSFDRQSLKWRNMRARKYSNIISTFNISLEQQSMINMSMLNRNARIFRFIEYRNFLLSQMKTFLKIVTFQKNENYSELKIRQIMIIDANVFSVDFHHLIKDWLLLRENGQHANNVLCINGIKDDGYPKDWFATVLQNGSWIYENMLRNKELIFAPPNDFNGDFFEVQSCFGGCSIYSNINNSLFNSECKYQSTVEWLMNKIERNITRMMEYEQKLKQFYDIFEEYQPHQLFEDGDISEHLRYNYCLRNESDYNFYIAAQSKLYYNAKIMRNVGGSVHTVIQNKKRNTNLLVMQG